jgi:hypothetical protein
MVEPSAIVWFATELWDVSCAEAGTPKDTLATMNAAVIKYFIAVFSVFSVTNQTFQREISRRDKFRNTT